MSQNRSSTQPNIRRKQLYKDLLEKGNKIADEIDSHDALEIIKLSNDIIQKSNELLTSANESSDNVGNAAEYLLDAEVNKSENLFDILYRNRK